jgi:hypothetical protein
MSVFMSSARYHCQILMKHEFSRQIKNPQISNFMKIRPVGGELFHSDGRDSAKSHFSQFCERAKNQ